MRVVLAAEAREAKRFDFCEFFKPLLALIERTTVLPLLLLLKTSLWYTSLALIDYFPIKRVSNAGTKASRRQSPQRVRCFFAKPYL
jgi:hypothetical protein